jgi:hypothetical protein
VQSYAGLMKQVSAGLSPRALFGSGDLNGNISS